MSDEVETDKIITGDTFDVLPELPEDSIHAVVTDPPYGLNFMPDVTNGWDDFEPREYQDWCMEWAQEVKRVLKPGGHLLAFSGNRTHHRLFTGVEDAGFEIRDTLTWHYGSGFPKAADISKTIDKRADVEPESVSDAEGVGFMNDDNDGWNDTHTHIEMGDPTTKQAKKWDGWKTGLKPATEYVVMARKPFDGATVDCVLEHGTGALNIDATRIELNGEDNPTGSGIAPEDSEFGKHEFGNGGEGYETPDNGRYPSNVVFDETEAERLDRKVGELDAGAHTTVAESEAVNTYSDKKYTATPDERTETESGGPSRYFYTSKATKAERTLDGKIDNAHPTVKPQDLMEWLIKMVTRETQIVLDPFCGSGTTCKAAKNLNRQFIGIEKQAKWADVARVRCNLTPDDPSIVRGDESQEGLEAFSDD